MLSFSFLSDMSLSCVFFKKVAENRSVGCVFLHSRESNFLPQNHSQTTSSLYLFIIHLRTTTRTIKRRISKFITRRGGAQKNANAIVFAAAVSLSRKCCCCLNNAKERVFVPFFFKKRHSSNHLSVLCG